MISISDVHLTYRDANTAHAALRGINLDVAAGDFLALLGPSGCGKTTLLRCISGLAKPDSGRITIGNDVAFSDTANVDVPARLRDIGMVFQSYAIWPHLTVAQNAAFPLRYRCPGLKASEVRERTLESLRLVHLEALADRPAPNLSGGQQQRLALARALISQPKVLLLDEPLSNLDARLREEMRFELRSLTKRLGVTTILVTHEQVEALSLADMIAVMDEGLLLQVSAPRELYDRPQNEFVARFVGRANLVAAEVLVASSGSASQRVSVSTPFGNVECFSDAPQALGDRVTLAVQPESFGVQPADMPGARGTVEGSAFVGDATELIVRLAQSTLIAKVPSANAPAVGAAVSVCITSSNCMLLKT